MNAPKVPTDAELRVTERVRWVLLNAEMNKRGDCWEYGLSPRKDGYGRVAIVATERYAFSILAHRYVYALVRLDTTEEKWPEHVHHTCRNRLCVRPSHLVGMTAAEHAREHHATEAA